MMHSNSLDVIQVSDTGRGKVWLPFLKIGITKALDQSARTLPASKEIWKSTLGMGAMMSLVSLRIVALKASGPLAL